MGYSYKENQTVIYPPLLVGYRPGESQTQAGGYSPVMTGATLINR